MIRREWKSVEDIIKVNYKCMFGQIDGEVLSVTENTFKRANGEMVNEKVATVLQKADGHPACLAEVKLPFNTSIEEGQEIHEMCELRGYGAGKISVSLLSLDKE